MKSLVIAKKEIMDLTRDRRTMMMMFVVPFFAMPLMFALVFNLQKNIQEKAEDKILKVAIIGSEYAPELSSAFSNSDGMSIFEDISIDSIGNFINDEIIDAAIIIDKNYLNNINNFKQASIVVQFKGTESTGTTKNRVREVIDSIEKKIVGERMEQMEIEPEMLKAYDINIIDVASKQEIIGKAAGGFLPYMFVIFGFMGALYPALDLGSGEKERGTLETILSSPANRLDIVLGKVIVVSLSAILSAVIGLLGFFIGINTFADLPSQLTTVIGEIANAETVLMVMSLVLPICVFFSSILLGLSIYAKSFKEAQSITSPLSFVIFVPILISLTPGINLDAVTALIPILNVSLATKDIIAGVMNPFYMFEVYASLLTYAGLSILWCVYSFNQEGTIFRN